MIRSRRWQLTLSVLLVWVCVPAMIRGADKLEKNAGSQVREEPNQPASKLEFKTDQKQRPWVIEKSEDPAPVIPRYVAELYIRWYHAQPNDPNGTALSETSAGKSLSDLQRNFVKTQQAIVVDSAGVGKYSSNIGKFPFGRKRYSLFAVSEADAKKMASAVVEFLAQRGTTNAQRRMKSHIQKLLDLQKETTRRVAQAKEQLADKDDESTAAYGKYQESVKNSTYSLHSLADVPDELRKTIFEMNKMLDSLDIEIAGMKAKISAVDQYTRTHGHELSNSPELKSMLAQMSIRENIELIGAETRRRAILGSKKGREHLYGLYNHWRDLEKECNSLRISSDRAAEDLRKIENELADLQACRVHSFEVEQNNVFIHPVRVAEE
ncbi:MAG: hypothetical protein AMJ75_09850 [Phycisphaerae bacterium SM1_79]|nr:MAG: hypothetical protein AMJ75_09850 [Phycisphaerae bacterium SM1_79]